MGKAVAVLFIVMIQVATTMPLAMAGGYKCPPPPGKPKPPKTPHVPKTPKAPTIPKPPSTPKAPTIPKPPSTPKPPPGSSPSESCPLNALKLGACVDVLGGLVHVGIGDPVVNQCCPLLQGVLALEAALCLCTTIRVKLLNLNIFLPLALELIASCGLTPPPGFKCPS